MGFIEGDHFDDEQCLALLGRSQFGRIALSLMAVQVVFPVRYALTGGELLFALSVDQLAQALDERIATLQADGFEEDRGQRWTVFAVGPVRRVEGFEGPELAGTSGDLFRLQPAILSGRWIETL